MKYLLFLSLIAYCLLLSAPVAQAATPTPTPSQSATNEVKSAIDQQVNDLKDRIASRVAQLKLVERRGITGTVIDVTDTQISLSDPHGNVRFADVDELTKFASPSAKGTFGISDITKGQKLGIIGLYNKQTRRILARFVDVIKLPTALHVTIAAVDSTNFTITAITDDNKTVSVDVETITKTVSYTKDAGMTRAGFSKIKSSERAIIVGFYDIKDATHIIASRVILFPDVAADPKIKIPSSIVIPTPQETITPSTGSGKKLTPITR